MAQVNKAKDLYDVLGLTKAAGETDVKKAYRKVSLHTLYQRHTPAIGVRRGPCSYSLICWSCMAMHCQHAMQLANEVQYTRPMACSADMILHLNRKALFTCIMHLNWVR